MLIDSSIRCSECHREVDEFTAIAEDWRLWSDGRELLPYCPRCAQHEFGAPATEPPPLAHPCATQ
jgi:hypothetical protein